MAVVADNRDSSNEMERVMHKVRVGTDGWEQKALAGAELEFYVNVHRDEEANVFWAESDDLDGLIVEAKDRSELESEISSAAVLLLEVALDGFKPNATAHLIEDIQLQFAAA